MGRISRNYTKRDRWKAVSFLSEIGHFTISVLPSISSGQARPITSSMVGAMSAKRPLGRSSVPAPQRMKGLWLHCGADGYVHHP